MVVQMAMVPSNVTHVLLKLWTGTQFFRTEARALANRQPQPTRSSAPLGRLARYVFSRCRFTSILGHRSVSSTKGLVNWESLVITADKRMLVLNPLRRRGKCVQCANGVVIKNRKTCHFRWRSLNLRSQEQRPWRGTGDAIPTARTPPLHWVTRKPPSNAARATCATRLVKMVNRVETVATVITEGPLAGFGSLHKFWQ